MPTPSKYTIYPCGDHAVTIELGNGIDAVVNQKVMALFQYLKNKSIGGVKDLIPAYNTLTVVYDVVSVKKKNTTRSAYELMRGELEKAARSISLATEPSRLVKIPACYDLSVAPDLVSVAERHQMHVDDVIALHTNKTYRVYMIGFLPGFAYMGLVDKKIITPRKTKPRTLVPAGSVGIAGEQTGIYPFDSPGGWQLIGRTPVTMFDPRNESPCYLQPGDEVQFYPISLTEFEKLKIP